jgi:hypothetical protein
MDLAELGLKVDSSDLPKADKALDHFATSASKAEEATSKFTGKATGASRTTAQLAQAVETGGTSFSFMSGAILAAATAVGTFVSAYVGIKTFIDNTVEAEQVQSQLAAALKSTGGASGQTIKSLNDASTALQKVSNYGDEAIGTAQSILLTFTRIGGDAFPKATKAVLDLSERLGGDLQGAAIQVGKALNDPVLGVTALGRAGIQFTQSQKDMIKSMVDAGNTAGAQTIIFKELENQFGGSAAAARDTLGGALKSLSNAWGDLFEITGEGSKSLRDAIENLIAVLQSPAFMDFVHTIGVALFQALSIAINAIATLASVIPPIWDALKPLAPALLAVFGPTVVAMVVALTEVVGVALYGAVVALFALIAANPLAAFIGVVVTLISYFVDWKQSILEVIQTYGMLQAIIANAIGATDAKDAGIKIAIDAKQALEDLRTGGKEIGTSAYNGLHQGGAEIPPPINKALEQGGKSAANSIGQAMKDAQDLAVARYEVLNGVTAQVLGDKLIEGGKYIYNSITGSITTAGSTASQSMHDGITSGGQQAASTIAGAISAAAMAAAQTVGQRVAQNEATISKNQAYQNSKGLEYYQSPTTMDLGYIPGSALSKEEYMKVQADIAYNKQRADEARARKLAMLPSSGDWHHPDPHPSFVSHSAGSGFAKGGDFTIPGTGSTDSTDVSFRGMPGERVSVSPKNNGGGGKDGITIANYVSPEDMLAALNTSKGRKVITNIIQSDPRTIRAILGV